MKALDIVSAILVIVGALNWGLVGLFGFNLVTFLLGAGPLASIVYVLVGTAGVLQAVRFPATQRRWSHSHGTPHMA